MNLKHRTRRSACLLAAGAVAMAVAMGPAALPAQASTSEQMVAAVDETPGAQGLYFEVQTVGSTGWHRELVAGGPAWSTPAMTVMNNGDIFIAAVDESTDTLYCYWQDYQTTGWTGGRVSAIGQAAGAPEIAAQKVMSPGQPAEIAIVSGNPDPGPGNDPSFTYFYTQFQKSGWYSQTLPGGYYGQSSPDIAVGPNNEIVVAYDAGEILPNGFYLDVQPYLSTNWSELHVGTGNYENAPRVEVQSSGNIIIGDTIGVQNDFGGTEFYWSPANDIDSWNAEHISSTMGMLGQGSVMADNPTAGSITLTAESDTSCVTAMTQDYGPNPWTTTKIGCPGLNAGPISLAARADGGLIAADTSENGNTHFYWLAKNSTTWTTEPTLTGLPDVSGGVAVASYTS
ncbi:MAG TPA: hypothetical protein VGX23_01015 [Actinocrinis sp.]|nr:hypothetical protein [Actinocrinis sp.]